MGRSEVAARWPVISMAGSLGNASNSDVGCRLTAMIAGINVVRCGAWRGKLRARTTLWMKLQRVDGGEQEGWRGGAERSTYIDSGGGRGGGQAGAKYPL